MWGDHYLQEPRPQAGSNDVLSFYSWTTPRSGAQAGSWWREEAPFPYKPLSTTLKSHQAPWVRMATLHNNILSAEGNRIKRWWKTSNLFFPLQCMSNLSIQQHCPAGFSLEPCSSSDQDFCARVEGRAEAKQELEFSMLLQTQHRVKSQLRRSGR